MLHRRPESVFADQLKYHYPPDLLLSETHRTDS
jgi:hypothetical protein